MTPEKQRIAIAEACGIKVCKQWHGLTGFIKGTDAPVPYYLYDLNAMHEAEKTLTDEQYATYALHLGPLTKQRQREYISATAAQRAEAFLRTIGKWEESA